MVATFIPFLNLVVATLWGNGIVALEPNGPFVQALEGIAPLGLLLGPIGLIVFGLAVRFGGVRWIALFVVGLPVLAILWFIGAAYLGGLAGEPF